MASSMSEAPTSWTPIELLYFGFLSTLPIQEATKVLNDWNAQGIDLPSHAVNVLSQLPSEWFNRPLTQFNGDHWVFQDGMLKVAYGHSPQVPPAPNPVHFAWLGRHSAPQPAVPEPESEPVHEPEPTKKPLRPLNSFMVYRSYLAPLFPGIAQKFKSSLISNLWAIEPLKAEWAILARAYTFIRDQFLVANPSLPEFIELTADLINVPTPQEYIELLGYRIHRDGDVFTLNQTGRCRVQEEIPSQIVTVEDVLEFCQDIEYIVPKEPLDDNMDVMHGAMAVGQNANVAADPGNFLFGDEEEEVFSATEIYEWLDPVVDVDIENNFDPSPPPPDIGADLDIEDFDFEDFLNDHNLQFDTI